jgi:hypothetical protein
MSRTAATWIAVVITLIELGAGAYQFNSMLANTHLPLWAVILLNFPRLFLLMVIWFGWWLFYKDKEVRPRWFGAPLLIFSVFFSLSIAHRVADHYFLVYLYGSSRVESEHLHLVRTGKNNPWPVTSNGRQIDLITNYDVWMYISEAAEASVFFPTFFGILYLLPRKGSGPLTIWIKF